MLENWGREKWPHGNLWEGGRKRSFAFFPFPWFPTRPVFSLFLSPLLSLEASAEERATAWSAFSFYINLSFVKFFWQSLSPSFDVIIRLRQFDIAIRWVNTVSPMFSCLSLSLSNTTLVLKTFYPRVAKITGRSTRYSFQYFVFKLQYKFSTIARGKSNFAYQCKKRHIRFLWNS